MLCVVVMGWFSTIRDHKWRALRVLVVGWAAWWAFWITASWMVLDFDDWLFVGGVADIRWFWRVFRMPPFHILVGIAIAAATGLVVGRSDRRHGASFVLLFFVSHLLLSDLPRFVPAAFASWEQPRFWWIVALDFIAMRLPIVLAGIWAVGDGSAEVLRTAV
jgi:hypothetical protein